MTKEKIEFISKEFFRVFYDLTREQLNTLDSLCRKYGVTWFNLFCESEESQKEKIKEIARVCMVNSKTLWEFENMWSPSTDKKITRSAIKTIELDDSIMDILKKSRLFKLY